MLLCSSDIWSTEIVFSTNSVLSHESFLYPAATCYPSLPNWVRCLDGSLDMVNDSRWTNTTQHSCLSLIFMLLLAPESEAGGAVLGLLGRGGRDTRDPLPSSCWFALLAIFVASVRTPPSSILLWGTFTLCFTELNNVMWLFSWIWNSLLSEIF